MRLLGFGFITGLLLAGAAISAQTDTRVDSSKPVASPDGKRSVVIDRLTPVVDGEAERYSGRMLIRVTSNDGTPAKQRYIEASQVRLIQPPVWLDGSKVCAFLYNIAKNSNGIVYFEPETNRAVQVEIVMPIRTMASGKEEQELTSFEVTEFSNEALKINNIPWKGGSAFPLVIDPLPSWQDKPYDLPFYNKLNSALASYKQFLKTNSLKSLEPEQASESFSEDEKWLGFLACGGTDAQMVAVPLSSGDAAATLARSKAMAVKNVTLACSHIATENTEESSHDNRYLTKWISPAVVQVIRESYTAESDEPVVTPLASINVSTGVIKDELSTGTQSQNP